MDDAELVRNKFIGKWPLKVRSTAYFKTDATTPDSTQTVTFTDVVDTLVFSADGNLVINGANTTYSFDNSHENITYNTTPSVTWNIEFLRVSSIILSRSATGTLNGEARRVKITETLQK